MTLVFTMTLLIGLIIFGSLIMINLIVAIIITDIDWLHKVSKLQVLRNQVSRGLQTHLATILLCALQAHHAVQIQALQSMFKCLPTKVVDKSRSLTR